MNDPGPLNIKAACRLLLTIIEGAIGGTAGNVLAAAPICPLTYDVYMITALAALGQAVIATARAKT